MSKKYRVPVTIRTEATATVGYIECDSAEEFNEKAEKLWDEMGNESPSTNCSNDFDLSDWDLAERTDDEVRYYLNT